MPGSTVLVKPNSSGKTLFARCDLEGCWSSFRDDLKASSQRRQTENRSFAKASRCSASVLTPSNSRSTFRNSLPSRRWHISFKPVESVKFQIGTRISAVQVGNMERQTARLKTNRARIQKRRRDRDGFNVF
jgi:hypothetical protein